MILLSGRCVSLHDSAEWTLLDRTMTHETHKVGTHPSSKAPLLPAHLSLLAL
jgi:hypothetical protein